MGVGNIWDKFEKQIDVLARPEQPKTAVNARSKAEVYQQLKYWKNKHLQPNLTPEERAFALAKKRELESEMEEFEQYRENYGKREYATARKVEK